MRIPTLSAVVLLAGMTLAAAQNPILPQPSTTAGTSTVTGCLKGSVNQYYVVEKRCQSRAPVNGPRPEFRPHARGTRSAALTVPALGRIPTQDLLF
jgi:hypothetical protein